MQTRLCNILQFFTAVKNDNFQIKIVILSNLCSKHRLRVHIRAASLKTSTHNLCFRAKIVYPCKPQCYYIKVGSKGSALHGHPSMMNRLLCIVS